MKGKIVTYGSSLLVAAIIAGSAAVSTAQNRNHGSENDLPTREAAEQVILFFERARAMWDAAAQLEAEAEVVLRQGGGDAKASHMLQRAKGLAAAAEVAEATATDYLRQVPHNQMD